MSVSKKCAALGILGGTNPCVLGCHFDAELLVGAVFQEMGPQRCGSSSSMRLAGWVGTLVAVAPSCNSMRISFADIAAAVP